MRMNVANDSPYYCPECGQKALDVIEETEPDGSGEYKEVCSCGHCENIVYLVRNQ